MSRSVMACALCAIAVIWLLSQARCESGDRLPNPRDAGFRHLPLSNAVRARLNRLNAKRVELVKKKMPVEAAKVQSEVVSLLERELGRDDLLTRCARIIEADLIADSRLTKPQLLNLYKALDAYYEGGRLLNAGEFAESRKKLLSANETIAEMRGEACGDCLRSAIYLGDGYAAEHNFVAAVREYEHAMRIAERIGFKKYRHPEYGLILQGMAWIDWRSGDKRRIRNAKDKLLEAEVILSRPEAESDPRHILNLAYLALWNLEYGTEEGFQKNASRLYRIVVIKRLYQGIPKNLSKRGIKLLLMVQLFGTAHFYQQALLTSKWLLKELEKPQAKLAPKKLANYYDAHAWLLEKLGHKAEGKVVRGIAKSLRE